VASRFPRLRVGTREGVSVAGNYKPHATKQFYSYRATWLATSGIVRWTAVIELPGERLVGRPRGVFNPNALGMEQIETWVRAAVELTIERLAAMRTPQLTG